jgi:hypothetical protein
MANIHNSHNHTLEIRLRCVCGGLVCLQLGRIPEDVLAVITGRLLQGLAFMHAKHMVSNVLDKLPWCGS